MELFSFPLASTFLIIFLFILVKKGLTQNKSTKLPPGPWKLPLIGSLHHLLGVPLPHHTLRNLARKHGPIMHLQLGENSTIVVSSAKIAKAIMSTHDLMFADRRVQYGTKVLTYGGTDIIFAPYGDYWRQMRKVCILELLSAKRVQSFESVREEEVSNFMKTISKMEGSVVNLSKMIFSLMNDIVARAAFGKKCKDKDQFLSLLKEGNRLSGGFDLPDLFPSLKLLHALSGKRQKLEEVLGKVDVILEDIVKEHKEKKSARNGNKDEYGENLVDVLVRVQESSDLEIPITTDNLKAVILDMFAGGNETSTTLIEWAMAEMLKNPRVMNKAQAEVRRVLGGNKKINETDIQELSYLKSVIKETLRLHPPIPLLLPRECREGCEIDGYEIPIKTMVIVNSWAIATDPEYWSDPNKFEPERFDELSIDYKGTNFEFIPFGAGRRICPGMFSAVTNAEVPLAHLLYHFDWQLPNGAKPEEMDMTESFGVAVQRKQELCLIPILINDLEHQLHKINSNQSKPS